MGKINYSKTDSLPDDEFSPKYAKEKISIWLDEATVDEFRRIAQITGKKYQSLINEALREAAFPPKSKKIDQIIEKLDTASKELRLLKKTGS